MRRPEPLRPQRGAALWLLLIGMLLAAGYAFYRQAAADPGRQRRDAALLATMAGARDALIARAVTDDNRPGSLPCPDLVTDSAGLANHPGDGKADMFTGTQCPSYLGWLPWVTLDLPVALDDSASRLWYALSPSLRDDDSAQPINSDAATALQLDDRGDIAALIIAPRAALAGQTRPSRRPADHLESGNGVDLRYVSGPAGGDFNDLILPLGRRELMAAVEKRIAGELLACLEQHAAAPGNPGRRYPWPAAIGDADFRGQAGSRFGRVALSQPGAGPQAALANSGDALARTLTGLDRAADPASRSAALESLGEQLAATRNLADMLFAVAERTRVAAETARTRLHGVDDAVAAAVANDRISRSEGQLIRERDAALAEALEQLAAQLAGNGVDAFPSRLAQLVATLDSAQDSASRTAAITASSALLAAASSPRGDVNAALAAAQTAAVLAAIAPAADAAPAAGVLRNALAALEQTIAASRANLLAADIDVHAAALAGQLAALAEAPEGTTAGLLRDGLSGVQRGIESLNCGIEPVANARNAVATALAAALATDGTAQLRTASAAAIEALRRLGDALAANEAADGNLSRTSLDAAFARFTAAAGRFSQIDQATPRPAQRDIVPYADALDLATLDLATIAEMLAANAATIAPLAAAPAGSDPARDGVGAASLRGVAEQALASLGGRNGSLAQQRTLLAGTGNSERAAAALAETRRLAETVLAAAGALARPLSGAAAAALPTVWLSPRCDFLRAGNATWWSANRWADGVFYQFSAASAAAPGQLTINGRSGYRLVTLAAGRALALQRRDGAAPGIGDFLEDLNADPSRNPPASSPSGKFVSAPATSLFNDQLAY